MVNKMSIKNFLLFLVIFLIGVPLYYLPYQEVKDRTVDSFNAKQLIFAKQAADGIESFFHHYTKVLNLYAKNLTIVNFSLEGERLLADFYNDHSDEISAVTRVDENGKIIFTFPLNEKAVGTDISQQKHNRHIIKTHKPVLSDVFRAVQGFDTVAYAYPVFRGDVYTGCITILIPFNHIAHKYLHEIQIGADGYAWLISASGVELYCPVPGHQGKTVYQTSNEFPSVIAMVEKMMLGEQGMTIYSYNRIKEEGVETTTKHAVFLPIRLPNTFWSIVVATPSYQVFAVMDSFRNKWLLFTLTFICSAFLFSFPVLRASAIVREEKKRRRAEDDLKVSLEKYRVLFETFPIGITITDNEGTILEVNKESERLLGISVSEQTSKSLTSEQWHVVGPNGEDLADDDFPATIALTQNRIVRDKEIGVQHPDGSMSWIVVTAAPIPLRGYGVAVGYSDITERRIAEEQRKQSEVRYRELFENAAMGIFLTDAQPKIFDANPRASEITGFSHEELCGFQSKEVIHPNSLEKTPLEKVVKNSLEKGVIVCERLYCTKHGPPVPVEVNLIVSPDTGFHTVMFQDITERKQSEAALQESEMFLLNVFASIQDGISVLDTNMVVRHVNPTMQQWYPGVIIGKKCYQIFHGNDKPCTPCPALRTIRSGHTESDVIQGISGSLIEWLELTSYPVRDEHGVITGVIEFVRDITERKRAEDTLRKSEESLSSLFRTVPAGIGVAQGRIFETVNGKLCAMTGYSRDELIGSDSRILYPSDEEYKRVGDTLYTSMHETGVGTCEAIVRRRDGSEMITFMSVTPLDDCSKDSGEVFVILDISRQKESEKRFEKFFEDSADATILLHENQIIDCNRAAINRLGYASKENVLQLHPADISPPIQPDGLPSIEKADKMIAMALEQESHRFEWIHRTAEGEDFPVEIVLTPIMQESKQVLHAVWRDISDRKQAEKELQRYHDELEEMVHDRTKELSETVDALKRRNHESETLSRLGDLLQACETDEESYTIIATLCGQVFSCHSGFLAVYDEEADVIRTVAVFGGFNGEDIQFDLNECWALRRGGTHLVVDPTVDPVCSHTGGTQDLSSLCVPIGAKGEFIGLLHLIWEIKAESVEQCERDLAAVTGLAKRVAELYALSLSNIRLRARLLRQSIRDPLTRLYNRRHMEESLRREIARATRKETGVGIILFDVDHFKKFNDTYGHDAGDLVLRRLGQFMNSLTRGEDIACRYGGEEFLIIMPDCMEGAVMRRSEEIRAGIERLLISHGSTQLKVTVSVGIASYPAHGSDPETVVAAADDALYKAKGAGRNQVVAARKRD